jgi:hypothetical protein
MSQPVGHLAAERRPASSGIAAALDNHRVEEHLRRDCTVVALDNYQVEGHPRKDCCTGEAEGNRLAGGNRPAGENRLA